MPAQAPQALQAVDQALDLLEAPEVRVVAMRVRLARRVARAVRVVGDPVGDRGLEPAAGAGADHMQVAVDATEPAQELQRAHVGVVGPEVAAGRGERADEHGRDGVDRVDRRVGGEDHRPIHARRDGRAPMHAAVGLRLHPDRQVGLVPQDVLVDRGAEAPGDRRGEVRERRRARSVARIAALRVARTPQRRRAVEHEHRLDPRLDEAVHRARRWRPSRRAGRSDRPAGSRPGASWRADPAPRAPTRPGCGPCRSRRPASLRPPRPPAPRR